MKFYNFYFSLTGGTQKVAEIVSNVLTGEIVNIDLTDRKIDLTTISLTDEDVAVIAVPSYSGRVPKIAVERIAAIQGDGAKAILICVYGNRAYEDTLIELQDTAKDAGFRIIAAIASVAEHSIARRYAAGRPDRQDREQLVTFSQKILKQLSSGEVKEPKIPGNRPYRKADAPGIVPKPTKACTNCGICAQKCPVGAIDENNVKHTDRKVCISCMRCVSVCPHSARKVNRILLYMVNVMLKKACSKRKENELFL